MSLECCPKSNVHGQDLMALVTLHGRTLRSPSSKNRGEGVDDGWCGRLMVPNIRAGQSIDGWFPLEQTDGSPVIGSNISYLYINSFFFFFMFKIKSLGCLIFFMFSDLIVLNEDSYSQRLHLLLLHLTRPTAASARL